MTEPNREEQAWSMLYDEKVCTLRNVYDSLTSPRKFEVISALEKLASASFGPAQKRGRTYPADYQKALDFYSNGKEIDATIKKNPRALMAYVKDTIWREGMTQNKFAESLGMPLSTLKNTLVRTLKTGLIAHNASVVKIAKWALDHGYVLPVEPS